MRASAVVDSPAISLDLTGSVQGLSLYRALGHGYLIVGSLGNSDFAVYAQNPTSPADFLTRFRVVPNGSLSGATGSTGQAVLSFATPSFRKGCSWPRDQANSPPNVKLASWGDVVDAGVFADGGHLQIVTTDDPRPPDAGASADAGSDGGTDGGTGGTGPSRRPLPGPGAPRRTAAARPPGEFSPAGSSSGCCSSASARRRYPDRAK